MPAWMYMRKLYCMNPELVLEMLKTPEQRHQEQEQKRQEAKLRIERENKHFLERYQDFVDTMNCLYPDTINKYDIKPVRAGYGFFPFIYIIMGNLLTNKEKIFHLNQETDKWHNTKNICLWDSGRYEILEPLTTKEQMDEILLELDN